MNKVNENKMNENKKVKEVTEIREIRDYTIRMLGHDDHWALMCLKIIHNGIIVGNRRYGFIEEDRVFLSSIASQLAKGYKPSKDQMWWIKNRMPDYWRLFVAAKGVDWVRNDMKMDSLSKTIWPNMRMIDWTPPPEDIPLPPDFIEMVRMCEGRG